MNDADLQQLLLLLKTQPHFTLAFFAVLVGGLVRFLKSAAGDQLLKRIPKSWPAWTAVAIGFALNFLNARLNVHETWTNALLVGLAGAVLSGGGAIGGDQTLAKLLAPFLTMPPSDSDKKKQDDPPKPGGLARTALRALDFTIVTCSMGFLAILTTLAACGLLPSNTPQAKTEEKAVVDGTCTVVSAFAGSAMEQSFCADLDQLVQMGVFVRSLRADAGPTSMMVRGCTIIPKTTVCATDAEIALAIKNLHLPTDAGAP